MKRLCVELLLLSLAAACAAGGNQAAAPPREQADLFIASEREIHDRR